MKSSHLISETLVLLLLLAVPAAQAGEWTGTIRGHVGQKFLDDKDWPSLDQQFALGILVDVKHQDWPVHIVFDVIGTGDVDENGTDDNIGYTVENHLGIRKVIELETETVRPYLGGGVAFVTAGLEFEEEGNTTTDDDNAVGGWIAGGVDVELKPNLVLGAEVRYSNAEVTLFNTDREAGGVIIGITLGYHW